MNALHISTILGCLITSLLIQTKAYPQDKTTQVDKIFSFANNLTPGCACTISENGTTLFDKSYGLADLEKNTPIGNNTTFDIGSTRKQFIAATILLLVQEKRLALTDDIRKYIPELPDYGSKITIDHLLTHTSGIRDWTGLLPLAAGDPTAISLILRQRGLNFKPGEEWSYSNSGYVLLTEIAARATKTAFADLIRQKLFEPLGMKNTVYLSDMTQPVANKALGYAKAGSGWKPDMYLGNDRGGGAIFSTTTDLNTWNHALTNKKPNDFVTVKLQEPAKLNNGRLLGYARALNLDNYRDQELVWHSGSAAGYHVWMGRVPSQGLSIAVACNSDAMSATAISNRLLALYVIRSTAPLSNEDGPPPALSGDTLEQAKRFAGLYFNKETGEPITLAVDRERFRVAGGPGLTAVSKNRFKRWGAKVFFKSQDQFEILFPSDNEFEMISMEGRKTRYQRAIAYTPDSTELASVAGRFKSDELGATVELIAGNGVLRAGLNGQPNLLLFKPVHRDIFQLSGVFIQLSRNKAGKVTGFRLRNPVVSNIIFERIDGSSSNTN